MGEVIGYNGTPSDRSVHWATLLMLRQSEKVFNNVTDEKQIAVREQDKRIYERFLSDYAKKSEAA